MKNIFVVSLGCPKNLTDTEEMMGLLARAGCRIVFDEEKAEAVLLNTCGFIDPAVKESEREIKRLIRLKGLKKIKKIVVAGCLVEREKEKLAQKFPEVDAFVGLGSLRRVAEALAKRRNYFEPVPSKLAPLRYKVPLTMPHSAYIKIADGCDNRCSYCTIPRIRGRFRSKPEEGVLAEAREMASRGVKEISLVAQDTTSYGADIYGKPCLPVLLRKLAKIRGIEWIRLMYVYPEKVTDELLHLMADEPKICRYLDMPIQHISDRVLKSMNRRSTEKLIRDKLESIGVFNPGMGIRTSLIAGYPGETERDFKKLREFVSQAGFYSMAVFSYCREKGTPAAKMEGQVPLKVKNERAAELIDAQSRVVDAWNSGLCGKTLKVLLDGPDFGRTERDAPEIDGLVNFDACGKVTAGQFIKVRITGAEGYIRRGVRVV
ncbi:MAG: 30S ribosomal protein S12 methylthiotransferase RimO [bacterium]